MILRLLLACADARMPDVLQQVELPIISPDECRETLQERLPGVVCAFHTEKGTFQGDSGGPLVCKTGDHWWLHGVTSFVYLDFRKCRPGNCPALAVYSSVVDYSPWIQKHTGSKFIFTYTFSKPNEK